MTTASGTPFLGVTPPHTDAGLTNGTTYYYVVTTVKNTKETKESAEVSCMPLGAPTGVTATGGSRLVSLDWPPVNGADAYNIEIDWVHFEGE